MAWVQHIFLSTPSARRATGIATAPTTALIGISIHALREEGDPARSTISTSWSYFYPRPPRGGRPWYSSHLLSLFQFLSTPSARRATPSALPLITELRKFLSTPSARRATSGPAGAWPCFAISIHALREEGDLIQLFQDQHHHVFLSTPSARRATPQYSVRRVEVVISIHALREEGDSSSMRSSPMTGNFYPRPPRGGRLVMRMIAVVST